MSDAVRARRTPFKSQAAGHESCPNCNAQARVVVEREKPNAPYWQLYVICDKCKHETWVGFMSEVEKNRVDRHRELMRKWHAAKTPAQRGRIMAQVRQLASEEGEWERSL